MVYLIHGENYLESQVKLKQLLGSRDSLTINGDIGWNAVFEIVRNQPLFSENSAIVIQNLLSSKLKADQVSGMLDLFATIPPNEMLILYETQTIEPKNAVFSFVQKHGKVMYSAKPNAAQLKKWIKELCLMNKTEITEEALTILASEFITHLSGLENELMKLCLFVSAKKKIEKDDVLEMTLLTGESTIFELGDLVGEKMTGKALEALNRLFNQGVSTGYITVMLARHLRLLIKIKLFLDQKIKPNELAVKLKIPPFVIQKLIHQSGNFSFHELQSAYEKLVMGDWESKTGKKPAELALELWIETVSQAK